MQVKKPGLAGNICIDLAEPLAPATTLPPTTLPFI